MSESEIENRRKQPRFNIHSRITYTLKEGSLAEEREGYMVNMSSAGLCLTVAEPLRVGQEVFITRCVVSFCRRKYEVQWVTKQDQKAVPYTAGLMSPEYRLLL
ncbi:MAG: PilZ domain-containing protein [Candidatus Sulfobium sp.]